MNDKRKALGRGLDALLPSAKPAQPPAAAVPASSSGSTREIPLDAIDRNPFQTRGKVDESALADLTNSIRSSGVLQPIVVRPTANGRFQLMAGERRWLASQKAGKKSIPAVVRAASDEQAMEITIVENLQREDLNPMEQARAYERLSREFGLTQEQMAQRTGKERATVANFLRLMKLPVALQILVEDGILSMGHAKVLLTLNDSAMLKCADRVQEKALSVRQTEELVRGILTPKEREKPLLKPLDPNVKDAQNELQRALGCKVKIDDRKGKGKITIEYRTLEDFDRVVEILSAKN